MIRFLKPLSLDEKGQGLTEYLILLLLVAIVSIGTVKVLGNTVKMKLREAKDHINKEVVLEDKS
jgi:Flp pilus assembly pilin Flp